MKAVYMYVDGAVSGNPGPGGWACLLRYGEHEREMSGHQPSATNNQMELLAVIMGLEALKLPCEVHIVTDSQYVKRGITEWLPKWKANNWRTANKAPVKNRDLWERLEAACQGHQIEWCWIKGHAGHPENERVDRLAVAAKAGER